MQKLSKATVNAIAHNIKIDNVLQTAWDFVCSLAPTNEFDYAYTNTATEDYCDTSWHVVQNVKLYESLDLIDATDMYNNATQLFSNFVETNLATLSVEDVYDTLNSISGDTAMREEYYSNLVSHFKKFVADNKQFALEETEYRGNYVLTSTHSQAQKNKLVHDYCSRYDAYEYVELNNEL